MAWTCGLLETGLDLGDVIYEPLSKEEEAALFREYRETGSVEARNQLIIKNTKLVASVIKKYFNSLLVTKTFDADYLFQNGILGLMKAIEDYDPDRGSFSTLAFMHVRKAINFEVYANSSPATTGITVVRLYYRIMKDKQRGIPDEEIRSTMNIALSTYNNVLKYGPVVTQRSSLDVNIEGEEKVNGRNKEMTLGEYLLRTNDNNEEIDKYIYDNELHTLIEKILNDKAIFPPNRPGTKKAKESIRMYYLEGKSYRQIAEHFNVSRQAIQQTMAAKLKRIRLVYEKELLAFL